MQTDLFYLTAVTIFTGLLWLPYVLNRIAIRGLIDTVGYPENPKPQSPWAQRLIKAHANAIENLVVFATLLLVAHATGMTGGALATIAAVYFWGRVIHALAYTFALPWVRTLAFAAGFCAQAAVAIQLLSH